MKAYLLYRDGDLDLSAPLPPQEPELARDLELDVLLQAMARGDAYIYDVCRAVLHASLTEPEQIGYRQEILADWLAHPDVAVAIYSIAVEAIAAERRIWGGLFSSAGYILHRSLQVMDLFVAALEKLRAIADEQAGQFESAGVTTLFGTLAAELSDDYFAEIQRHLRQLRFKSGVLVSAGLDASNRGTGYVLRRPHDGRAGLRGLLPGGGPASYTVVVADRDINGQRTLSELSDRGVDLVADALAQSCDHIRSFFDMLRREVGFYIGCVRLHETLTSAGVPLCRPVPVPAGKQALTAAGLRDACLALTTSEPVAGNDVDADGAALIMITGANQGGKSTFLRSVGLAQLMMQCGMFVCAQSFTANVCTGVFTHYKRPEDTSMTSGKLDEELARMSAIVDAISPGGLLLCNESFAATNEREGSHIARAIVRALLEAGVKVGFVTHFYDLAHGFWAQHRDDALFLRADREPDGTRTFQLVPAPPLLTSFAGDVYERVFGEPLDQ